MPDKPILLYVVNNPAFFVSHRLPIAEAAMEAGYQVHIACPEADASKVLRNTGMAVHSWQLSRKGLHPLNELLSVIALHKLYRKIKPDVVHNITPKPNVYGGIAARFAHVPARVFAISGMGHMFSSHGIRQKLLRPLVRLMYRIALGGSNARVIVQNEADRQLIHAIVKIPMAAMDLIPGSGVDLQEFTPKAEPEPAYTVVMASRLFRDKGVGEFIEAARILKSRNINARFILAGTPDPGNPESISEAELSQWRQQAAVELPGFVSDIADLYAKAHIVVLPSYYREGLPKSLIEAAACGRPIITTDMPGCRDAIIPDVSGLLIPPRDAVKLSEAINKLIGDNQLRLRMGKAGRQLAEEKFDIHSVVYRHLEIYKELTDVIQ